MTTYDAIVVGVGGMGSAALYHLARRGLKVLGLDRYDIPNDMGSSHGATRIIRLAYSEHPSYVPLVRRAYELWRHLEEESGETLLVTTGSIDAGPPGGPVFEGSLASCHLHQISHQVLSAREVNRRFPGYHLPDGVMALHQADGGLLLPEGCISAYAVAAARLGAEVRARERLLGWKAEGDGVGVVTDRGRYSAGRLVVCAGSWAGKMLPLLQTTLRPERQVVAWLQPLRPDLFSHQAFPVFNLEVEGRKLYGFPTYVVPGGVLGFKVGVYHHLHQEVDPDSTDRKVHREDEELLAGFASRYFPQGAGPILASETCIFTNTPDGHFILDRHPQHPQVVMAAGFSGHGFKFCSVVGEVLADLAVDGCSHHDMDLFKLDRFQAVAG